MGGRRAALRGPAARWRFRAENGAPGERHLPAALPGRRGFGPTCTPSCPAPRFGDAKAPATRCSASNARPQILQAHCRGLALPGQPVATTARYPKPTRPRTGELKMKPELVLLVTALLVCGCSQTMVPPATPESAAASAPAAVLIPSASPRATAAAASAAFGRAAAKPTCADQFSETDCQAHLGCRWVNAYKRGDGTYALPYCYGRAR
jgi:hypothetical protein